MHTSTLTHLYMQIQVHKFTHMHALQVSHHIHCNDDAFDEDVVNAFPILRFDARQPRYWYHQYQHMCVASLRACLCVCVCVFACLFSRICLFQPCFVPKLTGGPSDISCNVCEQACISASSVPDVSCIASCIGMPVTGIIYIGHLLCACECALVAEQLSITSCVGAPYY